MMLQLTFDLKVYRILLTKSKSTVASLHGQAMLTNSMRSKSKVKATSLRTPFKLHIISTRTLEFSDLCQITDTAAFIATPMKKHIQQFILPLASFFQFVDRKVVSFMPKYSLLAVDTNQVSIFFLPLDKLVMLAISKVFTILFYSACKNKEYPGSFKNKSVIFSFK